MRNIYFATEGAHMPSRWRCVVAEFIEEGPQLLRRALAVILLETAVLAIIFGLFKLTSKDQLALGNLVRALY